MPHYVVRAGDHLAAIAHRHGLTADAIWNHDNNADLRARREGHVLAPGDVMFLPASERREPSSLSVGSTNSFRANVPKVEVSLRLHEGDRPIRGAACELVVGGGRPISATSDGDGNVRFSVRVTARRAKLRIPSLGAERWLAIGDLDPVDTVRGAQTRLRELGYYTGPIDGVEDEDLADAVRAFQAASGRTADGVLEDGTRRALAEAFGV
jgi:N-acetylmuramoyl-L-alanine amidase